MTTYEKAVKAGIEIDSHESDLFLKDCKETREIIKEHLYPKHASSFVSAVDSALWWEIPFAYDPFWEKVHARI